MYLLRINIEGTINYGLYKYLYPALKAAEGKKSIAGLILVFNSGGGDAASSQLIHDLVKKIRKKKPVYSLALGICASGAYWIASASTKIYAIDTSLIGSIGVISIRPNVKKLMEKIGVDVMVYKSGKYKDMTSPFSEPNEEEKSVYQRLLDDIFEKFKRSVAEDRGIPSEKIDEIANGMVYSAKMAADNGLIDRIANYDDLVSDLTKEVGKRLKVKEFYIRKPLLQRLLGI
ncbi:proteinase IV [Thermoplasma volcanium GSS1]|uniref:Proteinase IV n=1 Tax=Thermoplasma volcanium (strain ATCC 51530 / DSM 4299 / JCM 9571 / NBRC 15438 / GSS1) TaxID=273116 RepID=Q97CS2_THEVO|nr:signal peptide peptidase SppA [Thermoplasma volcanium]BAB59171.1 proteinase IV [Thermoplasma volcanium GSS1]CAT00893.1 signal peptide peptidase-like protein [Thermoplasma volcanium GSS1]